MAVWHEPQGRGERRGGVVRGHARAGLVVRLADDDEAQVQIGEDLVCGKITHERSAFQLVVVEMQRTNRRDAVLRPLEPDGSQARSIQGRSLGVGDNVERVVY